MMRISIFFAWYDFWVGGFYDRKKRVLYICPLPMCVIQITLPPKAEPPKETRPISERELRNWIENDMDVW